MTAHLPEPLKVPWDLKENPTAKSGFDKLQDGRTRYWIDEVLAGITPEMLAWWFSHLDGDTDLDGRRVPKYRVWHPYDHVYVEYIRRSPNGSIGPEPRPPTSNTCNATLATRSKLSPPSNALITSA